MKYFVSVIIPRSRPDVPAFLHLLQQDCKKNCYEIIVVSHKKFSDDIEKSRDSRIKTIFVKENNATIKRNNGAKAAKGNFLIFLDDDAIPEKNWISKNIELLEKSNADIIAGPNIGMPFQPLAEEISDILLRNSIGSGKRKKFKKGKEGKAEPKDFSTCNIGIKSEFFKKIGMFDESIPFNGEDTFFLFNAKEKGAKFYYSPEIAVFHKRKNFPFGHMRQLFNWGNGNGSNAIRNPKMLQILDISIPPMIFIGGILALFAIPINYAVVLAAIGIILIFLLSLKEEGLKNSALFAMAFPAHFLSYAFGLCIGMVSGIAKKISGN